MKILFLFVAYPELNPIEMARRDVKRSVAARNLEFNLTHVENETRSQIEHTTVEHVRRYAGHARKEEQKYRELCRVVEHDTIEFRN